MKLRVLWPGKTKQSYYRDAIKDYSSRIARFVPFEIVETKEYPAADRNKQQRISKESKSLLTGAKDSVVVVLDPDGKQLTSEEFAAWIEKQNRDIAFIVGGPAGLEIEKPALELSFGRSTFPHELVRVMLLEQLFRAFTILNRVPYHK
jgi:23S rRNA (pseudouridine1915-N3)-methyltransferase